MLCERWVIQITTRNAVAQQQLTRYFKTTFDKMKILFRKVWSISKGGKCK